MEKREPVRAVSEAGTTREEASQPDGAGDYWNWCPRCGHRLRNDHCKLKCPRCHYFMSCSDFD